jgi:hypothetical protein
MGMFSGGGGFGMMGGMGGMFGGMFGGGAAASEGMMGGFEGLSPLMMLAEKGGYIPHIGFEGIATRPMAKILHFAKGGISPATGLGGIVGSNVMVNVGEKAPSQMEAVVPLPDNKSIPVTFPHGMMDGSSGGSSMPSRHDINLAIELNSTMLDASELRSSREEIVKHVRADIEGDGDLRHTIRESIHKN